MSEEQSYVEIAQKRREKKTYLVRAPTGYLFTLCRPNIQAFIASGQLPTGLLEKMFDAQELDAMAVAAQMKPLEQAMSMLFMGSMVRQACVKPRIVEYPRSKDEIRFEDIDDEDFLYIFNWCKSGGVEGENLAQFREGQEQAPINRTNGKKRKSARK